MYTRCPFICCLFVLPWRCSGFPRCTWGASGGPGERALFGLVGAAQRGVQQLEALLQGVGLVVLHQLLMTHKHGDVIYRSRYLPVISQLSASYQLVISQLSASYQLVISQISARYQLDMITWVSHRWWEMLASSQKVQDSNRQIS